MPDQTFRYLFKVYFFKLSFQTFTLDNDVKIFTDMLNNIADENTHKIRIIYQV